MNCVFHSDRNAIGTCNHCGKNLCSECQVQVEQERYCKECVAKKVGDSKKEEHSPVLAALLSFVFAGLGQIYNGQVGKGILIFFTAWLIIPWIIGIFDAYKTAVKIHKGQLAVKSKPGCMIAAVAAVAIVPIGIAIMALLAAIAIPNFLRAKINAYDAHAQETLRRISDVLETRAAMNNAVYPSNLPEALKNSSAEVFPQAATMGFTYTYSLSPQGYTVTATPVTCWSTGSKIFTLKEGGVISSRECRE